MRLRWHAHGLARGVARGLAHGFAHNLNCGPGARLTPPTRMGRTVSDLIVLGKGADPQDRAALGRLRHPGSWARALTGVEIASVAVFDATMEDWAAVIDRRHPSVLVRTCAGRTGSMASWLRRDCTPAGPSIGSLSQRPNLP